MAGFRSVCRPASRRNGGRLEIGIPGRLRRNTQVTSELFSRPCAVATAPACPDSTPRPLNAAGPHETGTRPGGACQWTSCGKPRSVTLRNRSRPEPHGRLPVRSPRVTSSAPLSRPGRKLGLRDGMARPPVAQTADRLARKPARGASARRQANGRFSSRSSQTHRKRFCGAATITLGSETSGTSILNTRSIWSAMPEAWR